MFETSPRPGTFVAIVPTPPKDPSQRRRRNVEQPKRATSTALPAESRRKAPPPPSWLAKKFHADYRRVWTASVAHLWPPSAAELVGRLVVQRERVHRLGDECTPAHMSVLLQLERELLLGPKAARASGVTVRDESAPTALDVGEDDGDGEAGTAAKPKRSTVPKGRRDRILRAVQ